MKGELKIAQEKLMKVEIENQSNVRDVETLSAQKMEMGQELQMVRQEKDAVIEKLEKDVESLNNQISELKSSQKSDETSKTQEIQDLKV